MVGKGDRLFLDLIAQVDVRRGGMGWNGMALGHEAVDVCGSVKLLTVLSSQDCGRLRRSDEGSLDVLFLPASRPTAVSCVVFRALCRCTRLRSKPGRLRSTSPTRSATPPPRSSWGSCTTSAELSGADTGGFPAAGGAAMMAHSAPCKVGTRLACCAQTSEGHADAG